MKRFLVISLVCLSFGAMAQRNNSFSIQLDKVSFKTLVTELETKTNFRFYYKPDIMDSVKVSITLQNTTIPEVLDKLFSDTEYHYFILDTRVFVTYQREVAPLAEGWHSNSGIRQSNGLVDISEFERRNRRMARQQETVINVGKRVNDGGKNGTITGSIRDLMTGDPLIGAAIFIEKPEMKGTSADQLGNFSLTLPRGRHELIIKSVGMKTIRQAINLYSDGTVNFEMAEEITALKEVVVESERDVKVNSLQLGTEKLDIRTMKNLPLALGETDVLKVMLALPGVQSVGEGSSGINVRGGATNQNLILFNNALVFNPSHLFGFFSSFNPDVVANAELYKSGITPNYGGRISSVLDITSRTGNKKKWTATGGISPITGRITLEGPIIKEKTSLLIGGRTTYSNWILKQIESSELSNSNAAFYDYNAILEHKFGKRHQLTATAYGSRDNFKLQSDTTYTFRDQAYSAVLKSTWSDKLFSATTIAGSVYQYDIKSIENTINAFNLNFYVNQVTIKTEFTYLKNAQSNISGGLEFNRYQIKPGTYTRALPESTVLPLTLPTERSLELAPFVNYNLEITPLLSASAGIRFSYYMNYGPGEIRSYDNSVPRSISSIIETRAVAAGEKIAQYSGFEPRLSFRYGLSQTQSIKAGFTRMRQYIQMLSNTTAVAPTDIWKIADKYIKPQIGDQLSAGYYHSIPLKALEFSVETYYKWIVSTIDFKSGSELYLNPAMETATLDSKGKAYGVELMLKRNSGRLNGWISYTWSRSLLQTKGKFPIETINNGNWYASPYDKPHAVNLISNYKFNRRINISFTTTYSTGRPITIPIAVYELGGAQRILYSERNAYRIPDYFRMDLSVNIEGSHKIKKPGHGSWTLALYNIAGRANAYSVFFNTKDGKISGYKLSIFARPIPTITYNFKI